MPQEEKLEDILRSIRNIIDNGNSKVSKPQSKDKVASHLNDNSDESILELIDEFKENENKIVGDTAFAKSSAAIEAFSKKLGDHNYQENRSNIDTIVIDLITPLLKDWLDNNLPRLVEKIISEELKKLVPKR